LFFTTEAKQGRAENEPACIVLDKTDLPEQRRINPGCCLAVMRSALLVCSSAVKKFSVQQLE
jgi:hypothetical protein